MKKQAVFIAIIVSSAGYALANSGQDTPDVRPRKDFRTHREAVTNLAFNHDGSLLLSAGRDGQMGLWDMQSDKLLRMMFPKEKTVTNRSLARDTSRRVEAFAFSPDGKLIAEAATEPTGQSMLRLWNTDTGEIAKVLAPNVDNLRAVAYSPDGQIVAYNAREPIGWRHKIVLCDPTNGKTLAELSDPKLAATMLAFSPDGKLLACAGARKIRLWDVKQRKLLHSIDDAHEQSIQGIAFSPNGKLLASGAVDDKIRFWKVDTGKMESEIEAEQDGVLAIAFTPSGNAVASGGKNHTVKLWKTDTGKKYARLWGHLERVNCVAVSPDGKTLASGSGDTTVALWDLVEPKDDEKDKDDEEDEWSDED